jgi:uncharacterized protein
MTDAEANELRKRVAAVQALKIKSKQGFASMPPERQREIAAMGGKAAHVAKTAHEFTPEEAAAAGRRGGASLVAKRGLAHMRELGRKGGSSKKANSLKSAILPEVLERKESK